MENFFTRAWNMLGGSERPVHTGMALAGAVAIIAGISGFLVDGTSVWSIVAAGVGMQPVGVWMMRRYDGAVDLFAPPVMMCGGGLALAAFLFWSGRSFCG